ncbi:hypothetical protein [Salinarimonas ramus]|uniref:Uncharacterized protein n=1 Tax=Salinarimonas ramus TaxID=690164 RepID=A0A917Q3U6_9HYPH|nr:hypothetical protein [Salinarimonas ramus]GGK17623.1 hypothetical protein GCM10011322_00410 [Salinarimonas ramus]
MLDKTTRLLATLAFAATLGLAATSAHAITNTQDTTYDRPQQDREFYSIFRGG